MKGQRSLAQRWVDAAICDVLLQECLKETPGNIDGRCVIAPECKIKRKRIAAACESARSAARTMASAEFNDGERQERPMLAVTTPRGCDAPWGNFVVMILRLIRSAITPASSSVVCGSRIVNSSPP